MKVQPISFVGIALIGSSLVLVTACSSDTDSLGTTSGGGGTNIVTGGSAATDGTDIATGGSLSDGGSNATGGTSVTGGDTNAAGGTSDSGGRSATGGDTSAAGGSVAAGGGPSATGGRVATGGGPSATGGRLATGGGPSATGGSVATGGSPSAAGGGVATGGDTSATGGSVATGGDTSATGGSVATGGDTSATGGSPGTGGATSEPTAHVIDLSTCTNPNTTGTLTYDATGQTLSAVDIPSFQCALAQTFNDGQSLSAHVTGTNNGAVGLRSWLINNAQGTNTNIISYLGTSLPAGSFTLDYTLTVSAGKTASYLFFKGPVYGTNIDSIVLSSVTVTY